MKARAPHGQEGPFSCPLSHLCDIPLPTTPEAIKAALDEALQRLEGLRREPVLPLGDHAAAIELLEDLRQEFIGQLDALTPDPDMEPSLGFSEPSVPAWAGGHDQRHIAQGATDGREGEHDGCEPPEDIEETLGRSENLDQTRREFGQDDKEPSLGSGPAVDQRVWGQRSEGFAYDAEDQCEGEGDYDEREPDDWGWEAPDGGTAYPSAAGAWPPRAVR